MIILENIRFKNILSFGNTWTTINFESANSFLVKGVNGSGKSAGILDTLCFALFGKPFRKINKPSIVNFKNRKDLVTELWFRNEIRSYRIVRGLNPQVFEIYEDGRLIDQNPSIRDYQDYFEKNILRMNFQAFTQMVLLGKATYSAFFRLQLYERRKFIESILNLSVFGVMSDLNKVRVTEIKNELLALKTELFVLKERIQMNERHIETLMREQQKQKDEYKRQINEQIKKCRKEVRDFEKQIEATRKQFKSVDHDLSSLNRKLESNIEIQAKISDKIRSVQRKIDFFQENATCPTCDTELESAVRETKAQELQNKKLALGLAEMKLKEKIEATLDIIRSAQEKLNLNDKYQREIETIELMIRQKTSIIHQLNEDRDNHVNSSGTFEQSIELETKEIEDLRIQYEKKINIRTELFIRVEYHDFISGMLKDNGIKAVIIKKYIPAITRIMNNYLSDLELFVRFELNENFEENFYARGINSLSYFSFSEGEKLRIDLAMLLTWREICKSQNNMSVNFVIFDEILDASLDETGAESLVSLFRTLIKTGVRIMVISHSTNRWDDSFDNILTFSKKSGFSQIEEERKTA